MRFWLLLRNRLLQMWYTGVLWSTFPFGLHLRIFMHSLEVAWWWTSSVQWTKPFLLRFHSKEHFKMWQINFNVLSFGIVTPSGVQSCYRSIDILWLLLQSSVTILFYKLNRLPRTAVDAPSLEVQDQIGWCCQHPGLVESAPACHGG